MPIVVGLDMMLARRRIRSKELAERIGLSEQQVSMLRSGRVRGVRFDTPARICEVLECQPGDRLVRRAGGPPQDCSAFHISMSRSAVQTRGCLMPLASS
jgi:putative transcriptional regulator